MKEGLRMFAVISLTLVVVLLSLHSVQWVTDLQSSPTKAKIAVKQAKSLQQSRDPAKGMQQ